MENMDLTQGVSAQDTVRSSDQLSITISNAETKPVENGLGEELQEIARGDLLISIKYGPDGEKIPVVDEKNLIVNASKTFLLTGIYLPNITSDPIVSLRAGSGGAIDPQGLYPKPEDPLQADLITPVITIPTVYVVGVSDISVKFLADIDQSQANGTLFTEAGLIKASGALFNIKNHPGIPKTSEFSIHYEWVIRFL